MDGDSFGMEFMSAKGRKILRTYRLYGTDCPESDAKDKQLEGRIREQAEYFNRLPEEIPLLGKEAAGFTRKLLAGGKPRLWTRGGLGQEVPKAANRPQRYYALVEVTAPDGSRRWLHELLLEAGLARAHGQPAARPPELEDRQGVKEAEERFMKQLETLERKARRDGLGVWKKPAVPRGRGEALRK